MEVKAGPRPKRTPRVRHEPGGGMLSRSSYSGLVLTLNSLQPFYLSSYVEDLI